MAWMLGFIAGVFCLLLPTSSWLVLKLASITLLFVCLLIRRYASINYKVAGANSQPPTHSLKRLSESVNAGLTVHSAILFLLGFGSGIFYSQWLANTAITKTLPDLYDGQILQVQGRVEHSSCFGAKHIGTVEEQLNNGPTRTVTRRYDRFSRSAPCKLRVSVTHARGLQGQLSPIGDEFIAKLSDYGKHDLRPNDIIHATVKLRSPRGFYNPGSFDLRRFFMARGLSASGYIKTIEQHYPASLSPLISPSSFRWLWLKKIDAASKNVESHGVLLSLLAGEKSALFSQHRKLFQQTGTAHLLAISGLHIGIAAGVGLVLARGLTYLAPSLPIRYPSIVWQASVAVPIATFYAFLAGFAIPTQRALVMFSCLIVTRCLKLNWPPANHLSVALMVLLLINPLSILDAGFWFSFVAVAIIFLSFRRSQMRSESKSFITSEPFSYAVNLLKMQLALMVAMPLVLIPFHVPSPVVSPIANLIAVPLVSLLIIPLGLAAAVSVWFSSALAGFLFFLCDQLLVVLIETLSAVSHISSQHFNALIVAEHPLHSVFLAFLCYLFFQSHYRSIRSASFVLILILIFPLPTQLTLESQNDELIITQLDVGQGTAIHLESAGSSWLYDTGARWSKRFDLGDAVVLPYFRKTGTRFLDTLVLSHGDNDHAGGADSVLSQLRVGKVLLAGEPDSWMRQYGQSQVIYENLIKRKNKDQSAMQILPIDSCVANKQWQLGRYTLRSLWPQDIRQARSDNDRSCVLQIIDTNGHGVALLPGDISSKSERAIVYSTFDTLESDLLVVAHHGSKSSSSTQWLDTLSPKIALVSAGFNNRYRHPHPAILERLSTRGTRVYQSQNLGAIRFIYRNGFWTGPFCARYKGRYFWQVWNNTQVCKGPITP